jgi:geranylgeranylglycerol-phosphate geranylgeranyltransferase
VTSVLSLIRARNLLLTAAGVAIGGILAQGSAGIGTAVGWAIVSAMLLGAAGNAANDLFDREADRINRPDRPIVSGRVSPNAALLIAGAAGGLGLLLAYWVSARLFFLALFALAVMLVYSPAIKPLGLPGNVAVAVIASLPPVYGALALGNPRAGYVPFIMGAFLHFAREIVKDLEDIPGDLALGRRTVPVAMGRDAAFLLAAGALVLFVPASLAPWFGGWYGLRYGIAVLLLDAGIAVLIARLLARHEKGTRAALKIAMVWGLLAVLWDRL